jgi:hypothetical protein
LNLGASLGKYASSPYWELKEAIFLEVKEIFLGKFYFLADSSHIRVA